MTNRMKIMNELIISAWQSDVDIKGIILPKAIKNDIDRELSDLKNGINYKTTDSPINPGFGNINIVYV